MRIQFDPLEDASNQTKHGVSLVLASELEWDAALVWSDERRDYGELRRMALEPFGERLFAVVLVDRPAGRRIISLRKANPQEVTFYAANDQVPFGPQLHLPTPEEDAAIAAGIAADPDTFELTSEQMKELRPLRGRPPLAAPKEPVKLRLDPDVLAALRASGPGWQTRVNELLRREVLGEAKTG